MASKRASSSGCSGSFVCANVETSTTTPDAATARKLALIVSPKAKVQQFELRRRVSGAASFFDSSLPVKNSQGIDPGQICAYNFGVTGSMPGQQSIVPRARTPFQRTKVKERDGRSRLALCNS